MRPTKGITNNRQSELSAVAHVSARASNPPADNVLYSHKRDAKINVRSMITPNMDKRSQILHIQEILIELRKPGAGMLSSPS